MKSLANKKLFLLDHSDSRHHISETFISTFMLRSSRTKMLLSTFFKIPHLYKHGLNPPPSLELRCGILPPFRGQLQTLISKKMWNVNFRLADELITVTRHHNDVYLIKTGKPPPSHHPHSCPSVQCLSGHQSTCCRQEYHYSKLHKLLTLAVGWLIFGTLPSDHFLACCWFLLTNSALFILPARLAPVVLQSADGRQENFGLIT